MDRRNFLSLASFAGLSVASLDAFGRPVRGLFSGPRAGATPLSETYRGPLFLTVHAAGGWDPTSLCDPKGAASDVDPDAMNWSFRGRDIGTTASGIRYAPQFHRFFERHDRRLLVINGVDMGTLGHEDGARHLWSGQLAEGTPGFAALVAAAHGRDLAMGYVSYGRRDDTQGEVARTRGTRPTANRAFNPDRADGDDADEAAILEPNSGLMYAARTGPDELERLQRYLPELDRGDNPLIRQIQVAIAAYRAGVTVAVDLELDGFDTHVDHDAEHIPRLAQLLAGLDFLVDEAARQEIGDEFVVLVGSEFGRTPGYNASNGKDHGATSSFLAMGKGVVGGRVVGATTERHEPLAVDPRTLAVSDRGVRIEPRHIQHDLRRLAGITADPVVQRHPLAVDDAEVMRLFG